MTISKGNGMGTNNQTWDKLLSPSEEGLGGQNNILRRMWLWKIAIQKMKNTWKQWEKLKLCVLDFHGVCNIMLYVSHRDLAPSFRKDGGLLKVSHQLEEYR